MRNKKDLDILCSMGLYSHLFALPRMYHSTILNLLWAHPTMDEINGQWLVASGGLSWLVQRIVDSEHQRTIPLYERIMATVKTDWIRPMHLLMLMRKEWVPLFECLVALYKDPSTRTSFLGLLQILEETHRPLLTEPLILLSSDTSMQIIKSKKSLTETICLLNIHL